MARYGYDYGWRPYVSVAERRRKAAKKMAALRKKGINIQPVEIEGRKIAKTFWGAAWCDHLESFSDYANRLPRGRTYVRNGSVCHLGIAKGKIDAKVSGSSLYEVKVKIEKLSPAKWRTIKQQSAGQIGSLLELLQGKLSDEVMHIVTDRKEGLFPLPKEISFGCDCPDWADMCKHIAAVMYGIGARLDASPELLFKLRGVNHEELIAVDAEAAVSSATTSGKSKKIATNDLSDVFGIDLSSGDEAAPNTRPRTTTARKKAIKKKAATKNVAKKTPKKKTVKRKKAVTKKAGTVSKSTTQKKSIKKKKK
jgi:uncharacterized Zn finger protein